MERNLVICMLKIHSGGGCYIHDITRSTAVYWISKTTKQIYTNRSL